MKIKNDSEFGYVELDPNINDYYDIETGEEIYVPSNYPFDIPKVYIEGCWCHHDATEQDSIISVRENIVTIYKHYDNYCDEYDVEEYDLNTLEKKLYNVTLDYSSRIEIRDYYKLLNYIDPNIIKRINNNEDTNSI